MTVPDFQKLMLPVLTIARDGQQHSIREAAEVLARQFHLTPTDRAELLPSGRQPVFENRLGWARTYLKKAGLLDSTERGRFHITPRGLEVLEQHPSFINIRFLTRYPEFREFTHPPDQAAAPTPDPADQTRTPEELLDTTYQSLRQELAQELIDHVKGCSPQFFEQLVVKLLVTMGYGGSLKDAGEAIGRTGDDGIDGIIKEDRLGLDVVYIQAKRWGNTVGRPTVQAFAGSLEGQRARKGVLITTSKFSSDAVDYVTRIEKRIVLIDGEQLAQHMIDFGVGVADVATYQVKRLDLDYFEE